MRVRVRVRVWSGIGIRPPLREQRRVASKVFAEILSEIDEVGTGVEPVLQIRNGDQARGVDIGVRALDDHVPGGIDVDAGREARVGLDEPDDDGDVVGDALKRHRDCAVELEEVDGTTVVVGERRRFGLQGRVGVDEGDEVLADVPFGVFHVGECGGAALGENGVEELRVLLV